MGLNPPIPLIFHRRAGHLGHSWRRQLEESLHSVGGQLLGCMSNLNSQVMTLTGPSVPQQGRLFMPCLPKSLESESHVVRHFPHLPSILIGHLHIIIFSHQVQGPDLRDPSQLRVCPNTVQVIYCFSPGTSHSFCFWRGCNELLSGKQELWGSRR